MKLTVMVIVAAVVTVCAEESADLGNTSLRTESTEFSPEGGPLRIETTYRGSEKIMSVMIRSNVTTRALLLNGDARYIESDEDGDGHFDSVMLPGEWAGDFEMFHRERDGGLTPVSGSDLQELKTKAGEASEVLLRMLEESERQVEPSAAHEPPPAVAVPESSDDANTKSESEAPADSGGR